MESIGETIQVLRKDAKLQQKYVALTSGIDPSTYSLIERGKKAPTENQLQAIADTLEIEVWEIASHWADMLKASSAPHVAPVNIQQLYHERRIAAG